MDKKVNILGFAGSLRKESYNKLLLKAAQELIPSPATLEIFDLKEIPLYNQDEESHLPASVALFKKKVKEADAILIATPEYNYSVPGVLKNALDWGSRPWGDNSWDGKPVALMGASQGLYGTLRAQYHLRQIFVNLNMYPLNKPELMVGLAQDKFDKDGHLMDDKIRKRLSELLLAIISQSKV